MNQFRLQNGGVSYVRHNHDQARNISLLVAHWPEVYCEMTDSSVAIKDLQIEVIDLPPGQGRTESFTDGIASTSRNQADKWHADQVLLLVAHLRPAAVRIGHEADGIHDKNQTLSIVENSSGKIALAL